MHVISLIVLTRYHLRPLGNLYCLDSIGLIIAVMELFLNGGRFGFADFIQMVSIAYKLNAIGSFCYCGSLGVSGKILLENLTHKLVETLVIEGQGKLMAIVLNLYMRL